MKSLVKTILIICAATVITTACSTDKLEIEQPGAITTNEYTIADDEGCKQFIAGVYSRVRGTATQWYLGSVDSYSGLNYKLGMMGLEYAQQFQYNESASSETYLEPYSYLYQTIYWCNMIIEYLPDNTVASADVVSRIVAEARAVRAIFMMKLVMLWGNPPLADHILQGDEGNTDGSESLDWIQQELSECAEDLPSKSSKDGQEEIGGRLTKEAAYAYLGKAYLYDKEYSLAASTLYNKVIATGLYELIDNYDDLNSSESDFCSEFLWEFDFNESYTSSQEGAFEVILFNWAPGGAGVPDGYYASAGWAKGTYCSDEFGTFMEEHDKENGVACARYRGTLASYEEYIDESIFSYTQRSKGFITRIENCQGYFKIRHIPLEADIVGSSAYTAYSIRNIPYMRYSEVLLDYAEAVASGGTAGSLSGLEALNIVRRRAGLSDAPSLSMDNETYGVKAERWAELYDEGHRFIDLVRWGDAPTELADCGKVAMYYFMGYLNEDHTTIQSKDQWNISTTASTGNGFVEGRHELFPYPEDELSNNPNIEQNPNW